MYLLIVFVLIWTLWISLFVLFRLILDIQIFIESNGVYSSLFCINVEISRPSPRTWWLLLTHR
jgi:hypothetical protein